MSVFSGILFHALGASSASLCYTPQKKTVSWSWQTYWMAQASICWLVLPLLVAWITIPELSRVLSEAPTSIMWNTFFLGALYGIGGTAFGLAIRYVGFSLTYGIAVGISCVLGTLIPPMIHGELGAILNKTGAGWVMAGIAMGAFGIALCGISGRLKEIDLLKKDGEQQAFSLAKGLPLCFLAGILSAVYGFALDHGQPIADIAARYGAGRFQGNVVYIFSNTGAFFSTLLYCLYLHIKQDTFKEYTTLPGTAKSSALMLNFLLAALTGVLWYSQFFFYGIGHTHMGEYKFSSWAIHMIMLVLFSSFAGLLMREWLGCRPRTLRMLVFAIVVLILAVLILTYGNYLGGVTE
jgi:L-rhamnose-H+ transport protein